MGAGVQDRPTLYNGYSYRLEVGLSHCNSHLQRAVISALIPEHRGPFDKWLHTGTEALLPHGRKRPHFFNNLPSSLALKSEFLFRIEKLLHPMGLRYIAGKQREMFRPAAHPSSPGTSFKSQHNLHVFCTCLDESRVPWEHPHYHPQNPPGIPSSDLSQCRLVAPTRKVCVWGRIFPFALLALKYYPPFSKLKSQAVKSPPSVSQGEASSTAQPPLPHKPYSSQGMTANTLAQKVPKITNKRLGIGNPDKCHRVQRVHIISFTQDALRLLSCYHDYALICN